MHVKRPFRTPGHRVIYCPLKRANMGGEAMRTWQWIAVVGAWSVVMTTGCAKQESSFEQAGKKMDAALQQMDRDVNKAVNQQ